jgi:hypothetical protein
MASEDIKGGALGLFGSYPPAYSPIILTQYPVNILHLLKCRASILFIFLTTGLLDILHKLLIYQYLYHP